MDQYWYRARVLDLIQEENEDSTFKGTCANPLRSSIVRLISIFWDHLIILLIIILIFMLSSGYNISACLISGLWQWRDRASFLCSSTSLLICQPPSSSPCSNYSWCCFASLYSLYNYSVIIMSLDGYSFSWYCYVTFSEDCRTCFCYIHRFKNNLLLFFLSFSIFLEDIYKMIISL